VRRHQQGEDGGESCPSDAMPRDGTERVFDRFGGELFAILFAGWEWRRASRAKGETVYVG